VLEANRGKLKEGVRGSNPRNGSSFILLNTNYKQMQKFIWGGIVVVALVFAGFLWYSSHKAKTKPPGTDQQSQTDNATQDAAVENLPGASGDQGTSDQDIADFNAKCETGEWVKIADQSGETVTASGKLRRVYPDDEATKEFSGYSYYLEGAQKMALTGSDLSTLDYFEDRQVEVQGVKNASKNELAVSQVRCAGAESDKNILSQRYKVMDYITANLNTLAPQKAKFQKWVIDEIDFVDENNMYVMYYDAVEDDENSTVEEDTGRKILVSVSPQGSGFDVKVNAYFEMGEDDYVLKTGTDKFADSETTDYSYDPDTKKWERL
jgi:hypothetical protein